MLVVWILLAFLAGVFALLAVPVDLAFEVHRHPGRNEGTGSLGWLFGLVRLRFGERKGRTRSAPKRAKARQRRKRGGARRMMAILRVEGFAVRLLRLARDLLRHVRIHYLSMAVRLGLDDPADTGRLWAALGPVAALVAMLPVARITIEPDFASETFEVDGEGRLRLVPIQLLFIVLVFLLSPRTLRVLRALRAEAR